VALQQQSNRTSH